MSRDAKSGERASQTWVAPSKGGYSAVSSNGDSSRPTTPPKYPASATTASPDRGSPR